MNERRALGLQIFQSTNCQLKYYYSGILGLKKGSLCSKNADEELSKVFREKHNALGLFLSKMKLKMEWIKMFQKVSDHRLFPGK